jgi:hypothetical protein
MNAPRILLSTLAIAGLAVVAGCGSAATRSAGATQSSVEFGSAVNAPAAGALTAGPSTGGSHAGSSGSSGKSASSGAGASAGAPAVASTTSAGDIVVGTPGTDVARSVTAAYTVPAGSFLSSFDTVIADAVALGGYVVRSATAPNSKGRIVSGSVTVAIPTAQMASLLNSLPSDFTASSINFASVDDTSDIVDLNARLTSAQAHLTALQGLLAKATSLDDITTLEQQIEDVETSIDPDQGSLTTLDQAVTYASATVRLTERGAVTVKAATGPSVSSGVSKGWNNLLAIAAVAVEVLVTAIPALILLIIGWAVWRRRRHSPAPRAEATA